MLKRTTLALLLAVVLMLSLFPIGVFAEEAADTAADTAAAVESADDTTEAVESADDTTEAVDDDHDHDHEKEFGVADIISLGVLVLVIVAVLVYCLTHKEKVGKFCRSLVSEFKKIVWSPWNQVRKNTLVVLAVVISFAIAIAIVDLLFSKSIVALGKLL